MGLKQNQALAAVYPTLEYFQYGHLPKGPAQDASKPFTTLAWKVARQNPTGHRETEKALDRLLEAKDAAVRAVLNHPVD